MPLRPYGLGTIYGGMVRVLRATPAAVVGAALLGFALSAAIRLAAGATQDTTRSVDTDGLARLTTHTRVGPTLVDALASLTVIAVGGFLVPLTLRLAAGKPARDGVGRPELRAAGAYVLVAVLGLPATVVYSAYSGHAAVLGLAVLVAVPLAYVTVRLTYLPAVLAAEGVTYAVGLRRCWEVARGSWWRTLGLTFMFALPAVVLAIPEVVAVVAHGLDQPVGTTVAGPTRDEIVASALASLLQLPMSAVGAALLYVDLRCRHEGLAWQLDATRKNPSRPAFGAGGTYAPPLWASSARR